MVNAGHVCHGLCVPAHAGERGGRPRSIVRSGAKGGGGLHADLAGGERRWDAGWRRRACAGVDFSRNGRCGRGTTRRGLLPLCASRRGAVAVEFGTRGILCAAVLDRRSMGGVREEAETKNLAVVHACSFTIIDYPHKSSPQ